jgi:hypothetical protein
MPEYDRGFIGHSVAILLDKMQEEQLACASMGDNKKYACSACEFKTENLQAIDGLPGYRGLCEICRCSVAGDIVEHADQYKGEYYGMKLTAYVANKILEAVRDRPPEKNEACTRCVKEQQKSRLFLRHLRFAYRMMASSKHGDWCEGFGCDFCNFVATMRKIPMVSTIDPGPWRDGQ